MMCPSVSLISASTPGLRAGRRRAVVDDDRGAVRVSVLVDVERPAVLQG
jgi:hypothetical protein